MNAKLFEEDSQHFVEYRSSVDIVLAKEERDNLMYYRIVYISYLYNMLY